MDGFARRMAELVGHVGGRGLARAGSVSDTSIGRWAKGIDLPAGSTRERLAKALCLTKRQIEGDAPISPRYVEWLKAKSEDPETTPPYVPDSHDQVLDIASMLVIEVEQHARTLKLLLAALQAPAPAPDNQKQQTG